MADKFPLPPWANSAATTTTTTTRKQQQPSQQQQQQQQQIGAEQLSPISSPVVAAGDMVRVATAMNATISSGSGGGSFSLAGCGGIASDGSSACGPSSGSGAAAAGMRSNSFSSAQGSNNSEHGRTPLSLQVTAEAAPVAPPAAIQLATNNTGGAAAAMAATRTTATTTPLRSSSSAPGSPPSTLSRVPSTFAEALSGVALSPARTPAASASSAASPASSITADAAAGSGVGFAVSPGGAMPRRKRPPKPPPLMLGPDGAGDPSAPALSSVVPGSAASSSDNRSNYANTNNPLQQQQQQPQQHGGAMEPTPSSGLFSAEHSLSSNLFQEDLAAAAVSCTSCPSSAKHGQNQHHPNPGQQQQQQQYFRSHSDPSVSTPAAATPTMQNPHQVHSHQQQRRNSRMNNCKQQNNNNNNNNCDDVNVYIDEENGVLVAENYRVSARGVETNCDRLLVNIPSLPTSPSANPQKLNFTPKLSPSAAGGSAASVAAAAASLLTSNNNSSSTFTVSSSGSFHHHSHHGHHHNQHHHYRGAEGQASGTALAAASSSSLRHSPILQSPALKSTNQEVPVSPTVYMSDLSHTATGTAYDESTASNKSGQFPVVAASEIEQQVFDAVVSSQSNFARERSFSSEREGSPHHHQQQQQQQQQQSQSQSQPHVGQQQDGDRSASESMNGSKTNPQQLQRSSSSRSNISSTNITPPQIGKAMAAAASNSVASFSLPRSVHQRGSNSNLSTPDMPHAGSPSTFAAPGSGGAGGNSFFTNISNSNNNSMTNGACTPPMIGFTVAIAPDSCGDLTLIALPPSQHHNHHHNNNNNNNSHHHNNHHPNHHPYDRATLNLSPCASEPGQPLHNHHHHGHHHHGAPRIANINFEDLELLDVVGKGATGFVQRAYHHTLKKFFAIKIVDLQPLVDQDASSLAAHPGLPGSGTARQLRFAVLRELHMLHAHYRSPHVLKMFEAFFFKSALYIVTEFMEYGNLTSMAATLGGNERLRKPLPERVLAVIAEQMLNGLVDMHSKQHIHRDLKPGNVLVNHHGAVKLSDFGLTVDLVEKGSRTVDAFMCSGTEWYMSPERMKGEPHGAAADIWSLGLTIAECAIGRFPFARAGTGQGNAFEMLRAVSNPIKYPPELASKLSDDFKHFVAQCMQVDPDKRPTAMQLKEHKFLSRWKNKFDFAEWLQREIATRQKLQEEAGVQRKRAKSLRQALVDSYENSLHSPSGVGAVSVSMVNSHHNAVPSGGSRSSSVGVTPAVTAITSPSTSGQGAAAARSTSVPAQGPVNNNSFSGRSPTANLMNSPPHHLSPRNGVDLYHHHGSFPAHCSGAVGGVGVGAEPVTSPFLRVLVEEQKKAAEQKRLKERELKNQQLRQH